MFEIRRLELTAQRSVQDPYPAPSPSGHPTIKLGAGMLFRKGETLLYGHGFLLNPMKHTHFSSPYMGVSKKREPKTRP